MKPVIHPYVEICPLSSKALDKMGFAITTLDLDKTKENWLRLCVEWSAKKDEWKTKYPVSDGCGSDHGGGSEGEYVHLEFPEIASPYKGQGDYGKKYKAHIDIGIYIKTGRRLNPPRLGYTYKFKENIKYGVLVWFAPKDFNDGRGDVSLFKWKKRGKI